MSAGAWAQMSRRIRILAMLTGVGAIFLVLRFLLPGSSASLGGGLDGPTFSRELDAALDSLMEVYAIDRRAVRTKTVSLPEGPALRIEQRIEISEEFVALRFNHDLATRLRPTGARVVGTERVRERLTALHVVRGGSTVWTLQFYWKAEG